MTRPAHLTFVALTALSLFQLAIARIIPPTGDLATLSLFEQAAGITKGPAESDPSLTTLESIIKQKLSYPDVARMLYTYEQQVELFKQMLGAGSTLESLQADLKDHPDTCNTIEHFVSFVFDNAADLLSHGAGTKHDSMRAFQQVVHIRAVLAAALRKMGKSLEVPQTETVCIDRAFIALYGWVKGILIGEAKREGTFVDEPRKQTQEQKLSLAEKKRVCIATPLMAELNLDKVKPLPGVDYPA